MTNRVTFSFTTNRDIHQLLEAAHTARAAHPNVESIRVSLNPVTREATVECVVAGNDLSLLEDLKTILNGE